MTNGFRPAIAEWSATTGSPLEAVVVTRLPADSGTTRRPEWVAETILAGGSAAVADLIRPGRGLPATTATEQIMTRTP